MEALGVIAFIVIGMVGFAFFAKNVKTITYWVNTPRYNKEYKAKMLRREIEDAQEELDRIEKP